eukprot:4260245-Pyramimonas_sp.AAC.1
MCLCGCCVGYEEPPRAPGHVACRLLRRACGHACLGRKEAEGSLQMSAAAETLARGIFLLQTELR